MQFRGDFTRWPSAVVAGIDVNGLGVVRSLGAVNVPTIVLDTDFNKSSAATRFGKKIPAPALSGELFVSALLDVAKTLSQRAVLILTQEDSVATVSAARERLSDAYAFSMPSHNTMQTLMNKSDFQRCAEDLNSQIPRSIRLAADTTFEDIASLRFPCVLKPLTKAQEYNAHFAKAYKVASPLEAHELWRKMHGVVDAVIMQEWIEGEDSDVYFCLQYRGASRSSSASFVGRKICQWPPQVGGTASCVPAPEVADELVALTDAFFDAVGFVGLGSMEYKRDTRDKKFYMVEPTVGRTDYQEEIATLNGVNIPHVAYCAELGRPLPPSMRIAAVRGWRDSLSYTKARLAGAPDSINSISPGARMIDSYFRADDPLPYLSLKLEPVTRRLRSIVGRL